MHRLQQAALVREGQSGPHGGQSGPRGGLSGPHEKLFTTESGSSRTALIRDVDRNGVAAVLDEVGVATRATVAFGCLVEPRPGDRVLIQHVEGEDFVLAVLTRPCAGSESDAASIGVPGGGSLAIVCDRLDVKAARAVSIESERIDLRGTVLTALFDTANWAGRTWAALGRTFRVAADAHEIQASRQVASLGLRSTVIEGPDILRAETQALTVSGMATERAEAKVVTVRTDLRMDATRISMG